MKHFLSDGKLEEVIQPVKVRHGTEARDATYARVLLNASGAPFVRGPNPFYSGDPMKALRRWCEVKPGVVIGHDRQFALSGTTQSGSQARTPWTLPEEGSFANCPEVVIEPRRVTFSNVLADNAWSPETPQVMGLIHGEPIQGWIRSSQIEVDNPHFKQATGVLDWLQIQLGSLTIVARKSGKWTWIGAFGDDCLAATLRGIRAFEMAMSFLAGRFVQVYALAVRFGRRSWRRVCHVAPPIQGNPQRYAPIARRTDMESALTCASTFFLSHPCRHDLRRLLAGVWSSAGQPVEAQGAQLGFAAEGIARLILENSALSKRKMRNLSACGRLGLAAHDVDVRFDEDDWQAFDDIRNRFSHGFTRFEFKHDSGFQAALWRVDRLASFMNRLLLAWFGYRGAYVDYGDRYEDKKLKEDVFSVTQAPQQFHNALNRANVTL